MQAMLPASTIIVLDTRSSMPASFAWGPLELYVEELAERVLLHLFNFRLASAHLGMLRAPLL